MEGEKSKIKNLFYCSKDLQCVLISTIQQSDSVIYRHTHTHTHTHTQSFSYFFHYGLSQGIEYISLCYTVGPCCLSVLFITVC